ncbi:hypothetical protein, partial [Microcystis aeruginosa]|uniref:hypothetical protein n=1 Tax=Microcystis aeruginosa TaxID=1126 RepID=UPI001C8A0268
ATLVLSGFDPLVSVSQASTSFVNTASYRIGDLEFWHGHDQIEQLDSGVEIYWRSQRGKT